MINWIIKTYYKIRLKNKLITNTKQETELIPDRIIKSTSHPNGYQIPHEVPIRQQGSIGSCASHAIIRAIEIQLPTKDYLEGSELYHYYKTRKEITKSYPKDTGMSIYQGVKSVYDYGFCPELLWKYETINYNKNPDSFAESFANLIKNYIMIERYYKLGSVEDIKIAVSNDLPVIFGLATTNPELPLLGLKV